MTEEEFQEQLELIRLTQSMMDNESGAHQKRWDKLLNNPQWLAQMMQSDSHNPEGGEEITVVEDTTIEEVAPSAPIVYDPPPKAVISEFDNTVLVYL